MIWEYKITWGNNIISFHIRFFDKYHDKFSKLNMKLLAFYHVGYFPVHLPLIIFNLEN